MQKHRNAAFATIVSLGLLVAACAGSDEATPVATEADTEPPATAPATASPTPTPGTDETPAAAAGSTTAASFGEPVPAPALDGLLNPDRSTFEISSLQGEPTLVFFGYTHCPDVCPATLGELFGVFEEEPEAQAVFVSVDPERDTPEFLEEWTEYLPRNLHAVTGTPGAIRRAADGWGVKYARVETTSTAGYTMSHTADLYLLDEDGQLLTTYPFGTKSAEIVEDLRALAAT
jgi:protein SCO1/2